MTGERKHNPKTEIRLSDEIYIVATYYRDGSKYRCGIVVKNILDKSVYAKFTKTGQTLEALQDYFENEGQHYIKQQISAMFDDGSLPSGVSFSFFYHLQKNSIKTVQIKGVTPRQVIELRTHVFEELGKKPLKEIDEKTLTSAFHDCASMMVNSRGRANKRNSKNEHNKWFNACISTFRPIMAHAVAIRAIEDNPIDKISAGRFHDVHRAITEHLSRVCLSLKEELSLMQSVHENWRTDDRYLALAFTLFLGTKPRELCALCYTDIVQNPSFPEMYSLRIAGQNDGGPARGVRVTHYLDNSTEYRNIPIPNELHKILVAKREASPDDTYIFCGMDGHLSAMQLQRFYLEMLGNLGAQRKPLELTDSEEERLYFFKLMGSLLQTHARQRMRQVCGMSESEVKYICGLSQGRDTDGAHYRDWNADVTQYGLYIKLNRRHYAYSRPFGVSRFADLCSISFLIPKDESCSMDIRADLGCTLVCKISGAENEGLEDE